MTGHPTHLRTRASATASNDWMAMGARRNLTLWVAVMAVLGFFAAGLRFRLTSWMRAGVVGWLDRILVLGGGLVMLACTIGAIVCTARIAAELIRRRSDR